MNGDPKLDESSLYLINATKVTRQGLLSAECMCLELSRKR